MQEMPYFGNTYHGDLAPTRIQGDISGVLAHMEVKKKQDAKRKDRDIQKLENERQRTIRRKAEKAKKALPKGYPGRAFEVHVFDIDGNYLETFRTLSLTAKYLNTPLSNVSRAVRAKAVCKKHRLSRERYPEWEEVVIYVFNLKGEFLDSYKDKIACMEDLSVTRSALYNVLGNRTTQTKGFRMSYVRHPEWEGDTIKYNKKVRKWQKVTE